eukprot:CAMPEP_0116879940 /NCGR_PEP_ID=MMETSP0463-20121206/11797_1 /TAXON_ID=181622 /ORGANISM="Strombidinopsis sp, Strain SopsisLIS2011" /LENGTH=45 /DNA_ID= /DNA_START= /DNA_END= /DNA_ORIENTATION=
MKPDYFYKNNKDEDQAADSDEYKQYNLRKVESDEECSVEDDDDPT